MTGSFGRSAVAAARTELDDSAADSGPRRLDGRVCRSLQATWMEPGQQPPCPWARSLREAFTSRRARPPGGAGAEAREGTLAGDGVVDHRHRIVPAQPQVRRRKVDRPCTPGGVDGGCRQSRQLGYPAPYEGTRGIEAR